jgi:hypothetical protein
VCCDVAISNDAFLVMSEQGLEQRLENGEMIEDAEKLLKDMVRDTPESCTFEYCWSEFI